jgi:hypothetical protein
MRQPSRRAAPFPIAWPCHHGPFGSKIEIAVDYARELGFEPHPDFAGCVSHLGPWDGSDITFGREGKPTYIEGPYDDTAGIIRTLRRSVGDDNFHYLCQLA